MRVLHIGAGNVYGGIERLLVTLGRLRHICPDVDPIFATCFTGRLTDELRASGAWVHALGAVRISRFWTLTRTRHRLAALLRGQRPDVAMCHSYWPHAIFAPVLRSAGVPIAFAAHDVPTGRHWLEHLARRATPDLVVANSRFTLASIPKLFRDVRAEAHYFPVELSSPNRDRSGRDRVRAELGATPQTTVIITACRLEQWKGHGLLLAALGQMSRRQDWRCWIVGGPQRPHEARFLAELKKAARGIGIEDRVQFLGQRSDVGQLLDAADVHCQPNEGPEPFGVAFVEALSAGRPVVTTACGGGGEIVTDQCGVLVPPADAAALADALAALVRDPEYRAELAARGPARARELCDPATSLPRLYASLATLGPVSKHGVRR